ncbi:hypothetical protein GCM10028783_27210 [Modestobacter muralis]
MRTSCGSLAPVCRSGPQGRGMDIESAYDLLAELELHEVEDLGADWFEAELAELLPLA